MPAEAPPSSAARASSSGAARTAASPARRAAGAAVARHDERRFDGFPCMVALPFADRNLEQIYQSERLSFGASSVLLREMVENVAKMHEKGLVHGDIKPGNILIDSQGRARVADFGVARTVSSTLGAGKRSSIGGGGARGTPGYMAPEVLRGASPEKPSDVFSFAMLVSMLLTGDAPFGHLLNPTLNANPGQIILGATQITRDNRKLLFL